MKKTIIDFNNKTSIEVDMSADEETVVLKEMQDINNEKNAFDLRTQQLEIKKISGKQKLLDMGLDEDEIAALTGI